MKNKTLRIKILETFNTETLECKQDVRVYIGRKRVNFKSVVLNISYENDKSI